MSSAMVPLLDDDTIPFGEEEDMQDPKSPSTNYTHPYVTFFHLFFRGAAIFFYIFCGLFSDSFITSFVFLTLLLSADFWTVKNITGRLLVGLRWWNYVDGQGKSHWVYEAKKGKINSNESRIFWLGLIIVPMFWGLSLMAAFIGFEFKWLLLIIIAVVLNGANLYGYIKCNFGANNNLNTAATDYVKTQIFKNAVDMLSKTSTLSPSNHTTGIV